MKTAILSIIGATDDAYVEKLGKAALAIAGVNAAAVSTDGRALQVQFDESVTSIREVTASLTNAGYDMGADIGEIKKSGGCCGGCGG